MRIYAYISNICYVRTPGSRGIIGNYEVSNPWFRNPFAFILCICFVMPHFFTSYTPPTTPKGDRNPDDLRTANPSFEHRIAASILYLSNR